MAKYNVGGFTFTDEESAKAAAKELKAVEYILGQLKDADDETVLKLYNKLKDQNMFSTEVGLSFMKQLSTNLEASGKIEKKELPKASNDGNKSSDPAKKKTNINSNKSIKKPKLQKKNFNIGYRKHKNRIQTKDDADSTEITRLILINRILLVLSITLGLCVLGMFYVNSTINSPTILNYEEEILNKYSSWEQELEEREQAVREKERSLE